MGVWFCVWVFGFVCACLHIKGGLVSWASRVIKSIRILRVLRVLRVLRFLRVYYDRPSLGVGGMGCSPSGREGRSAARP